MVGLASKADLEIVRQQLGRIPRGVLGVAARSVTGEPLVIATAPRLEDGSPFPTTYYLTHPAYVAECSRLEASGIMAEWTQELTENEELAAQYLAAHRAYLSAAKLWETKPVSSSSKKSPTFPLAGCLTG